MPAPQSVIDLVNRFESQLTAYKSGRYNETELRRDFLDPFFESLGWDVRNIGNASEKYRDVIHESSVEVGGQAKSADYLFKIGATPAFFVEAKKPSVNIETDPAPAFQLKSYAWSRKLPFSILTDFEHLAFYECAARPVFDANPAIGRIAVYYFRDYLTQWDEIAARISRSAVTSGGFDTFLQGVKGKRGTTDVDDAFLAEMERWRDLLAHNIALRNPSISQRELNTAVQTTIDRLIFLRICEDRGIEPEETLKNATDGIDVYGDLLELFRRADKKYNSGLFHFGSEKNRPGYPDTLTPSLKIDDRVFKDVLANLYLPKSPYRFNYFSADILGQVYERFLGRVIRLTPGHTAKVEEKPEVRKAGGVYYTPTYIVDYIVKNTVGELLKDKTPDSFKTNSLRVLDPACGSGSFLLGAYQFLLDWYLQWYMEHDPSKHSRGASPAVLEVPGGWQLTLEKKKEILTRHIYGVDIDSQAVEVTKLSLLLKVVENPGQLSLFSEERILPDLGDNINCGNSLIGPDFYDGQQGTLFDSEEQYRVNAFDWHASFPQVFKDGGFDAVIGNPPYIRIQALKEWAPLEVEFYKKAYKSASKGNYDIYVIFVEKGLSLLNQRGKLGFILPHKFFTAQYGESLRNLISSGRHLSRLVYFGDQQIFDSATTYTCLLFLLKNQNNTFDFIKVDDVSIWTREKELLTKIDLNSFDQKEWKFGLSEVSSIILKLSRMPVKLADISDRIFQGLVTGADDVFILKNVINGKFISKATGKEYQLESELLHPLCKGSVNIRRYHITELEKSILFPYELVNGKAILLSGKTLSTKYPKVWSYLNENRKILEGRENGKWKHEKWFALGRSQNLSEMEQKKILTPSIANYSSYTFDESDYFYFVGSGGGGGGGYGITLKDQNQSYKFVLGLLNSKLLDFYLKSYSSRFSGGYYAFNRQYIEQLPIKSIDFSNKTEIAQHDHLVALVETMLALHKSLTAARLPDEKERLQRQIDSTDHQIDQLVYQLYDLTPAEIAIVEGS